MEATLTLNSNRVFIHDDVDALIVHLASVIQAAAVDCQAAGRHYYLSLAGGSTPKRLYASLARDDRFDSALWSAFEIYFGDERYVPHDSEDSNYRMVKQAWLDHVPIPAAQVHPVPTQCSDIQDCARNYADQLATLPQQNGVPCFDLALLGMGDDGHTASLFPGTPVLNETSRFAAEVFVSKLDSYRITLTYPVLNNARRVVAMVTGQAKARMLKQVLTGPDKEYPIQRISNPHGVDWFVDRAAAEALQ